MATPRIFGEDQIASIRKGQGTDACRRLIDGCQPCLRGHDVNLATRDIDEVQKAVVFIPDWTLAKVGTDFGDLCRRHSSRIAKLLDARPIVGDILHAGTLNSRQIRRIGYAGVFTKAGCSELAVAGAQDNACILT